jgi:hypothetical protein
MNTAAIRLTSILAGPLLVGFVASMLAAPAAAVPTDNSRPAGNSTTQSVRHSPVSPLSDALARERYYSSYGTPQLPSAGIARYLSSLQKPRSVTPPVSTTPTSGFHWGDAAIGGGTATALLAILFAGTITVRRRHTRARSPAAAP